MKEPVEHLLATFSQQVFVVYSHLSPK